MSNDSTDKNNGNSFEYRLREVSDEEIISILRYRDHFQPTAVKAAIKEAIKRGIISSIEDLDHPDFQPQALTPRSLFPLGITEMQTIAIFKSLCRIFYGFGLLPIIFGILELSKHFSVNGVATILLGALVIFIANRLEKTQKPFFANILLAFNIPAFGFAIYYLTSKGNPSSMDGLAVLIVILVLLYTTLYAKKLTAYYNKNRSEEK